jgi:hypothetical protein
VLTSCVCVCALLAAPPLPNTLQLLTLSHSNRECGSKAGYQPFGGATSVSFAMKDEGNPGSAPPVTLQLNNPDAKKACKAKVGPCSAAQLCAATGAHNLRGVYVPSRLIPTAWQAAAAGLGRMRACMRLSVLHSCLRGDSVLTAAAACCVRLSAAMHADRSAEPRSQQQAGRLPAV